MDSKRGLLIGRYQPFHNGHLEIVREIMQDPECSELIVAIGSAQESYTMQNPFTAGERVLMLDRALSSAGFKDYFLIPIPDLNRYAVWVAHVESLAPPIDLVYTNNSLTRRLFAERGYYVKAPKMYDREQYSGTKIRQRIVNDGDWQELVPVEVAEIIQNIDGIKRLQELASE